MSLYAPLVWVAFRDGKMDKRGLIRGFIARGRGRKALIHAIVQVKDLFRAVALDDLTVIRAPKKR